MSDELIIDFLFGEASPEEESRVRRFMKEDTTFLSRVESFSKVLGLIRSFPESNAPASLRLHLDDQVSDLVGSADSPVVSALIHSLYGECSDEVRNAIQRALSRSPQLGALDSEVRKILQELRQLSLNDLELRNALDSRIEGLLREEESKTSSQREDLAQVSTDLSELVDYHLGELASKVSNRKVESRLKGSDAYRRLSRSVHRILRILSPLALTPRNDMQSQLQLLLDSAHADELAEPAADVRELIDFEYGQLGEGEEAHARKRLSDNAVLQSKLTGVQDLRSTVHRFPTLAVRDELVKRIRASLQELSIDEEALNIAPLTEAEFRSLPRERREAIEESNLSELAAMEKQRRTLKELPSLDVSENLLSRIEGALRCEEMPLTESDNARKQAALRARVDVESLSSHPFHIRAALRNESETEHKGRRIKSRKPTRPRVRRQKSMAFAVAFHAVLLFSLTFVLPTHADQGSANWIRFEGSSETSLPLPRIGEQLGSPELIQMMSQDEDDRINLENESLPALKPWDTNIRTSHSSLEYPHSENLVSMVEQPLVDGQVQSLTSGMGSGAPQVSHVWFELRRKTREEKATYYPVGVNIDLNKRLGQLLGFLAENQLPNGSWEGGRKVKLSARDATSYPWTIQERKMENTALALLAFLSDGYSSQDTFFHKGVEYRPVQKALDYIVEQYHHAPIGNFVSVEVDGVRRWWANSTVDAMCTLALVEAYGLSRDSSLKAPIRASLERLLQLQIDATDPQVTSMDAGGFAYIAQKGESRVLRADAVTGAWVMLALKSAKALKIPLRGHEGAVEKYKIYLKETLVSPVIARPLADTPHNNADNRISSAMAALVASTSMFSDFNRPQYQEDVSGVFQKLSGKPYGPSLEEIWTPEPTSQIRNRMNFTAWFFGSLGSYLMEDDSQERSEASVKWLSTLYSALFEDHHGNFIEAGDSAYFEFRGGEQERLQGYVFPTAMAALCITNAYRSELDEPAN